MTGLNNYVAGNAGLTRSTKTVHRFSDFEIGGRGQWTETVEGAICRKRKPERGCSATKKNEKHLMPSAIVQSCKVLVVGGGTGGCSVAAKLTSKFGKGNVIVLDPAQKHYYQPMFTLIGGGMKSLETSYKPMHDVLPKNAKWIQEKATEFHPDKNTVITSSGQEITYDILLVAMGLHLHYDKIPGLVEALSMPNGNVCSNYSPEHVDKTFSAIKKIEKGNAIFTMPTGSIKCPGAPQKAVYISEDYFRRQKKRKNINVIYNTSIANIFGVKRYADALWKIVEERDIKVNVKTNLVEVKPRENIAVFANVEKPSETFETEYSMLHAVPPMSAPKELAQCKQLVNELGYVDVNKDTLQHVKYNNVFAVGDCSSSPNSKTAAAAAAQGPVIYKHILATLNGKPLGEVYDGYASCPLVTGYSKCILAEFDYNLQPLETFPIPQNKERYSMFIMKKDFMPALYWHLMLNGYWNGPGLMRKSMSIFKFGN